MPPDFCLACTRISISGSRNTTGLMTNTRAYRASSSAASSKPSCGNPLCIQSKSVTALLWMERKARRYQNRGHSPALPAACGKAADKPLCRVKQCSPHDHSLTEPTWEVKKAAFLSYVSMLTPPTEMHTQQSSEIQKGHSWVKGLQEAKDVTRGRSVTAYISNSLTGTGRQVTDWDALNSVGL